MLQVFSIFPLSAMAYITCCRSLAFLPVSAMAYITCYRFIAFLSLNAMAYVTCCICRWKVFLRAKLSTLQRTEENGGKLLMSYVPSEMKRIS